MGKVSRNVSAITVLLPMTYNHSLMNSGSIKSKLIILLILNFNLISLLTYFTAARTDLSYSDIQFKKEFYVIFYPQIIHLIKGV